MDIEISAEEMLELINEIDPKTFALAKSMAVTNRLIKENETLRSALSEANPPVAD